MAMFAPTGRAEDLHYFKNYFVTGDYAVEGVGLYAKGVKGMATGIITMTAAKDVPVGADIVAAYLYWESVETTAQPSSMNGFFDFDSNGKPYPIVGDVLANSNCCSLLERWRHRRARILSAGLPRGCPAVSESRCERRSPRCRLHPYGHASRQWNQSTWKRSTRRRREPGGGLPATERNSTLQSRGSL